MVLTAHRGSSGRLRVTQGQVGQGLEPALLGGVSAPGRGWNGMGSQVAPNLAQPVIPWFRGSVLSPLVILEGPDHLHGIPRAGQPLPGRGGFGGQEKSHQCPLLTL